MHKTETESSGMKETGVDIVEKIKNCFESYDSEMINLGRVLCHKYRISYYALCELKKGCLSPFESKREFPFLYVQYPVVQCIFGHDKEDSTIENQVLLNKIGGTLVKIELK